MPQHPGSKDAERIEKLGTGGASKAAKAVVSRKERNAAAFAAVNAALGIPARRKAQTTDSNN